MKKNYQCWLCDLTHTKQTIASNTIPLGIGLLASYSQKRTAPAIQFRLFKFPEILIENLLADGPPQIVGFSNYFWNIDLSYSIAEKIKKLSPKTAIIFGGPNFPVELSEQEIFLKEKPCIDFYIYGEGERAFNELIIALINNNFDIEKTKKLSLNNCRYFLGNKFIHGNIAPRIEIKNTPSPYTDGLFDDFFQKLSPVIQTCRGCPFTCIYCCEGNSYFSKVSFREPDKIYSELEYIAKKSGDKILFISDSNFGMYEQDLTVCKILAEIQKKYDYPKYIYVATAKNNKERVIEASKITNDTMRLSASVQSTDPEVLKNIRRQNVPLDEIIQMAKNANKVGGNTYAEIILALPGDTKKAHFKSIEDMINMDLNYIRLYTLMMFHGSDLSIKETRKKFGLVTKFRVLPRCFGTYDFGKDKINSVEIEEVCVANKTLDFKDYLECRDFALTVEIFYNDGILSELLSFLKQFNVYPYALLKKIHDSKKIFSPKLLRMYDKFINETKNELWDSKEKLKKFAKDEKIIKKYVSGEYGSNLLFKYKTIAFTELIEDIHDIAFKLARELVNKQDIFNFMDELKIYSLLKKKEMLDTDKTYRHKFNFDMIKMDFKRRAPVQFEFRHDKEQVDIIKKNVEEFGKTIVGISRIFTRIYVKKMQRKAFPLSK